LCQIFSLDIFPALKPSPEFGGTEGSRGRQEWGKNKVGIGFHLYLMLLFYFSGWGRQQKNSLLDGLEGGLREF